MRNGSAGNACRRNDPALPNVTPVFEGGYVADDVIHSLMIREKDRAAFHGCVTDSVQRCREFSSRDGRWFSCHFARCAIGRLYAFDVSPWSGVALPDGMGHVTFEEVEVCSILRNVLKNSNFGARLLNLRS